MRRLLSLLVLLPVLGSAEEKRPGTVTLPLPQYESLVERSRKPAKRPPAPPVAAVLSHVELKVSVQDALARGTLLVDGEVLAAGTSKVPLLSGPGLLEVRSAGKAVPVLAEGGGYAVLLPGEEPAHGGSRPFALQGDWAGPVTTAQGQASFQVPVPRAGSVRASFEVPGADADVRVEPGLVTRRSAAAGRTRVEATLEPGSTARVSWSTREAPSAAGRAARYLADVKTVLTVGDADLEVATLVEIEVLDGEPDAFNLALPSGYELAGLQGSTLDTAAQKDGQLTLTVREPATRKHQFLLALRQSGAAGTAPFVAVAGAQRETGEIGVSALGTQEVAATEGGTLRRLDPAEASPALRTLAREPLLHAFRYHRRSSEGPALTLAVQRFEPAPVLVALAERAVVTTLMTGEGRTLTEIKLTVRNQAQPFLKISLPAGASIVSADVAGQPVKPALGQDGTRVPLLRAGFRPEGPYEVSFVVLRSGEALGKRGEASLTLPALDLPVSLLEWELFVPERFQVSDFTGDAERWDAGLTTAVGDLEMAAPPLAVAGIIGRALDQQGAALPGATVTLRLATGAGRTAITDPAGWYYFAGVPSGRHQLKCELTGFATRERPVEYRGGRFVANFTLAVGGLQETVEVVGSAPSVSDSLQLDQRQQAQVQNAPSANVLNLQRRVAGVLPVKVDVPRAGESIRLVRALVLEGETKVGFRYKARGR
jgi:hypothetical protein